MFETLSGVYAATLTPLKADFSIDLNGVIPLLGFLAERGCHGALLFGTTGEGPSFSASERLSLVAEALTIRQSYPSFKLLVGTGTPSLQESIELTRSVFDLGCDGVVVLPPYYYRNVSQEGLYAWFSQLIQHAVPGDGAVFGYHIPGVSGVPLSIELLARLKANYPTQFAGIKDSSGNPDFAFTLGQNYGEQMRFLVGHDKLFSTVLDHGYSGCITALANIVSPDLRRVWDAHQQSQNDPEAQARLDAARTILDKYPPAPPLLKAMLAKRFNFPGWPVRPPLTSLSDDLIDTAAEEFNAIVGI